MMIEASADAAGAAPPQADSQPVLTPAQITDGLLEGSSYWSGQTITYSVPTAASTWPGYPDGSEPFAPNHFTPLTAAQAARFADAVKAWDDLIAPHIVRTDDLTAPGEIRVGFSNDSTLDDYWGYASYPPIGGVGADPRNGDIWIKAEYDTTDFAAGGFDFTGLLHELGHALGLKHPFEDPVLPSAYDNMTYTVMSYTPPPQVYQVTLSQYGPEGAQAEATPVFAQTPMVLDVAAIQARYGADPATAAGDTVYHFDQNQPFLKTIYDASGIDTFDLSNFTRPSNVDLTPGAYSSIGLYPVAAQIADIEATFPQFGSQIPDFFDEVSQKGGVYIGQDNLGIAFSTTIENVVGGSAGDTITGNDAANGLYGEAGNDSIRGMNGDDVIDGGAGNDDLNGNQGQDSVYGGDGADTVRGGQGNDTVSGGPGDDPHVNGNLGDDLVYGGAGNDTVFGGQGNDTLYGEAGNDVLSGDLGNDILVGGPGQDVFRFRPGSGVDWVRDFNGAEGDRIELPPGVAYTLTTENGQLVFDLGGGDRLGLVGVAPAAFGNWVIFG